MQAYIDETMVRILESELNPEVGQLFQTYGLLDRSAARIDFCHSLHWLDKPAATDLHLIRKIRNRFAHQAEASFEDDAVRDLVASHAGRARIIARLKEYFADSLEPGELEDYVILTGEDINGGQPARVERTTRGDFILGASESLTSMVRMLYVIPIAQQTWTAPHEVLEFEHEEMPAWVETLKEAPSVAVSSAWKAEGILQGVVQT
jgi:hypothetical protein